MRNFTKLLQPFFLSLALLALTSTRLFAQCNAAFTYVINAPSVSFIPHDSTPQIANVWYFGDGQSSFSLFATGHTYSQPGQYLVKHIVFDSTANCTDSSQQLISVNFTATCQAYFSYYPFGDSLVSNGYLFNNASDVPGGFPAIKTNVWSVNGVQAGTDANFSYTFSQAGTYNVCLAIETFGGCTSQICQNVTVYGKCNLGPTFTYTVDSLYPASVTFYPHPDVAGVTYKWWLNGNLQTVKNPVAQFYQGGIYPARLFMFDSAHSCYDSTAGNFTVPVFPCDTLHFSYNYHIDPKDSALVYFAVQSSDSTTWQRWSITPYYNGQYYDSSQYTILNANNPQYHFTDTGTYQVCVQADLQHCGGRGLCDVVQIKSTAKAGANVHITPYPNPATNSVGIDVPLTGAATISINVYDASGIKVLSLQQPGSGGNNHINLLIGQLNRGQYFVDITAGGNRLKSVFQKF